MSNYMRVIPRDLFNEASLLKCIGRLVLLIEDGKLDWQYHHDGEAFTICQNGSNGALYIGNVEFWINKKKAHFERPLNSRDAWPLYLETENDSFEVFDDNGNVILKESEVV